MTTPRPAPPTFTSTFWPTRSDTDLSGKYKIFTYTPAIARNSYRGKRKVATCEDAPVCSGPHCQREDSAHSTVAYQVRFAEGKTITDSDTTTGFILASRSVIGDTPYALIQGADISQIRAAIYGDQKGELPQLRVPCTLTDAMYALRRSLGLDESGESTVWVRQEPGERIVTETNP